MTQASLSPDLPSAVRTRTTDGTRPGLSSEAALWLFALTSVALVVASVLLVGLLAQGAISDASIGGFLWATAIVTAAIGLGALAYVGTAAKRSGSVAADQDKKAAASDDADDGLRVAPAVPADLGRRKRLQLAEEQAARSRQAKAIASAEAVRRARTVSRPRPITTVTIPPATSPTHAPVQAPAPTPVQVRPAAIPRPVATPRRPAVVGIRPVARPNRPTPAPVFPRVPAPMVRPRTQVARAQVMATDIRARAMRPAPRPPVAPVPRARLVTLPRSVPVARPTPVARPVPIRT